MVTEMAVITEIAEAEAAGLKGEDIANLRGQVEGAAVMGMGMSYHVPEQDRAAWVGGWRLEVDYAGIERGKPVPLPKDRLGYYLSKRREVDGGRLFTLKMPEHLAGDRKFQCFIVPNVCAYKSDTKSNLVDHMEACHPRESLGFQEDIALIRASARKENTALRSLVDSIVNMPDEGVRQVPDEVRAFYDDSIDADIVDEQPTTLSITKRLPCSLCAYITPEGSKRPDSSLRMHTMVKHKDEV